MPLPPLLPGHVLAITGGLTGIGKAIATTFISHGASVSVNYFESDVSDSDALISQMHDEAIFAIRARSPSAIINSKGIPFLFVPGDVSKPSTGPDFISATVQRFGRIDTFISNAGICAFRELFDITPDLWFSHVNTNLSGAFFTLQAAARQMASQDPPGGSLIGISSISALVGGAQQVHYTPTKAGIVSLMQSLATTLGKHGIRCNALLPGTIRTRLNDEDLKEGSAKKTYMEGRIPLERLGEPDDMAGPAVFLACEELSGYVTGAGLLVDGGAFVNFQ